MNMDTLLFLLLGGIVGFSLVANAATFFMLHEDRKKRWVVAVDGESEYTIQYLVRAALWDPYGKSSPPKYAINQENSLKFHTHAAAEMAAVWVGGTVEEYAP